MQMRGIGMTQGVRADFLLDAGTPYRFSTGMPDAFPSNGHVFALVGGSGWKQIPLVHVSYLLRPFYDKVRRDEPSSGTPEQVKRGDPHFTTT